MDPNNQPLPDTNIPSSQTNTSGQSVQLPAAPAPDLSTQPLSTEQPLASQPIASVPTWPPAEVGAPVQTAPTEPTLPPLDQGQNLAAYGLGVPNMESSIPPEPMPTNLSDLGTEPAPSQQPSVQPPQAEVLVMPQNVSQVSAPPAAGGFPKWIILVGVLLILLVGGGSAYFILGVGQTKQTAAPTEQPPASLAQPTSVMPSVLPSPTTVIAPTAPAASPSGTSAIELLRKRQAGQ